MSLGIWPALPLWLTCRLLTPFPQIHQLSPESVLQAVLNAELPIESCNLAVVFST